MGITGRLRRVAALAAACIPLLVLAATAAAAEDQFTARVTATGTAAARAAIVRDSDLSTTVGWTAGPINTKPSDGRVNDCASFHPKRSDLVLEGSAGVVHIAGGGVLRIDSSALVFKQARMRRLDEQRALRAAGAAACLRTSAVPTVRIVSVTPLRPLPRIGDFALGYRILEELRSTHARFAVDVLWVGSGCTEINLITTSPANAAAVVKELETRLAQVLVRRAPA